jgi:hypothetical protein
MSFGSTPRISASRTWADSCGVHARAFGILLGFVLVVGSYLATTSAVETAGPCSSAWHSCISHLGNGDSSPHPSTITQLADLVPLDDPADDDGGDAIACDLAAEPKTVVGTSSHHPSASPTIRSAARAGIDTPRGPPSDLA